MNALRKTAEQKVSSSASKQVAKPRRTKDQHAMAMLIQRRGRTQAGLACQVGGRVRLAIPVGRKRSVRPTLTTAYGRLAA
jgi:hypothetical protein